MKHIFRFIGLPNSDQSWSLEEHEMNHLRKVLRLQRGDQVEVTDLKGRVDSGVIEDLGQKTLQLARERTSKYSLRSQPFIKLAFGALAAQEMDKLMVDLGEFDLESIAIFHQAGRPKKIYSNPDKCLLRWNKSLAAGAKQSKQAWIPEVKYWATLKDYLESEASSGVSWVWADETCLDSPILTQVLANSSQHVGIILGSEIGFTEEERMELDRRKYQKVGLGKSILRARTALILCAGISTLSRKMIG